MGKPCLLPEKYADKVELLEATPPDILNTPQRYAAYLASINSRNLEGQQRSFGDIAKETNNLFQSVGKDAFTPQKLSKFLNSATFDEVMSGIESDMLARSQSLQAIQQESAVAIARLAELKEREQATAAPAPTPPQPVAEASAQEPPQRPELLLEPNVLRGTLQFVEFLAHETGDEKLSGELHEAIGRMVGRDYTNPLIASSQELDKALVRHSIAVRELPGKAVESVQKSTQAVQDALTARAIQDKAALQNAIEPVQQAWKAISGKTTEAASAINNNTSALGNLFQSARAVAGAAVQILNESRKDGAAVEPTAAMQAMREHLGQRE